MIMRFREIQPEDLAALLILRSQVRENRLSLEQLEEMGITAEEGAKKLQNGYKGWLCEIGNTIASFSMGNQATGEMWVIAVLPHYEGRGIGKKLIQMVGNWLFEKNESLWLETEDNHNNRAYGFYEHMGWKKKETDGIHCTLILEKKCISRSVAER